MAPSGTIIIRKSLFGLFLIYFVGIILAAVLVYAALYIEHDPLFTKVLLVAATVPLLGSLVQAALYNSSYIELGAENIKVVNWLSIFGETTVEAEWNQVQNIQVSKGDPFAFLFDYGTVQIVTAGQLPNMRFTFTPNVEHWRDVMQQRADVAVTPVHNQ